METKTPVLDRVLSDEQKAALAATQADELLDEADRKREEAKRKAVRALELGMRPTDLADKLGVSRTTLYNWRDRLYV